MARITIYLPEPLAREARRRARQANRSVSAYVGEILARETAGCAWPQGLVDLLHQGSGDLVEPDDPAPKDIAPPS